MIIKLFEYDKKYRVVSLAKTEAAKQSLLQRQLSVLYVAENQAAIFPDGVTFKLDDHAFEAFCASCDYDVFEISQQGNAYKYYDNRSLDNAVLVTNRCNSNCIMCPTAESVRRGNEEYTAEELIEIARHFPSDAPHITITGGEPFLIQTGMFKLLNFLKCSLPNVAYLLLTNGRAFVSNSYTSLFKETAPPDILFGIPLHGYNAETHDYITQAPGSFMQTLKGLKHLLSINAKVELRIVVSRLNADFISEIAALIARELRSVYCVKIIGLEMTGNAAKNKKAVWLDYPSAFQKAKPGIDVLIRSGIDVGIYNFPVCAVEQKYWNMCEKSISAFKVRFASDCDFCRLKDACGGIFSGTIRLAKENVHPIR